MAIKFNSNEWIMELSRQLNQNADYERAARDWEGDFRFIVEPDEGCTKEICFYLGLLHGKSPGAAMMTSADERKAEFTIRAPFGTWKKVVEGKLDPIQGLMTGKLKLSGNLMKVMRYPKAAKEIINSCSKIPTDFTES